MTSPFSSLAGCAVAVVEQGRGVGIGRVVDAARIGPFAVEQIAAIDFLQHAGRRALAEKRLSASPPNRRAMAVSGRKAADIAPMQA